MQERLLSYCITETESEDKSAVNKLLYNLEIQSSNSRIRVSMRFESHLSIAYCSYAFGVMPSTLLLVSGGTCAFLSLKRTFPIGTGSFLEAHSTLSRVWLYIYKNSYSVVIYRY